MDLHSAATTLVFTPDGMGHGLYTETIDLACIGQLTVGRTTTIEFDNTTQYWRVRDKTRFNMFNSASRAECLEWEMRYIESQEDMKHG